MTAKLHVMVAQSPATLEGVSERLAWLENLLSQNTQAIDLLVLPELFISGYNIGAKVRERAIELNKDQKDSVFQQIVQLARQYQSAIHFGFPELASDQLYNSAACVSKHGTLLANTRKRLLPPGYESTYFAVGDAYTHFELNGFCIGTLICYDAEFPENFRHLSHADLVIVPTALGAQWGVVAQKLVPTRAFENGVFVCYANHAGTEQGMSYYGGSCVIAPDGTELVRLGSEAGWAGAVLDKALVGQARIRLPYHSDRQKLPPVPQSTTRQNHH